MALRTTEVNLAAGVIATDTDTPGSVVILNKEASAVGCTMTISSRTDGTYIARLQHRATPSDDWITLVSSSGIVADGITFIGYSEVADGLLLAEVRCIVNSASTTTGATVGLKIHYNRD